MYDDSLKWRKNFVYKKSVKLLNKQPLHQNTVTSPLGRLGYQPRPCLAVICFNVAVSGYFWVCAYIKFLVLVQFPPLVKFCLRLLQPHSDNTARFPSPLAPYDSFLAGFGLVFLHTVSIAF